MTVEIRTAAEMIALDVEGPGAAGRAARETALMQRVLRAFVDRDGSMSIDEVVETDRAFQTWRRRTQNGPGTGPVTSSGADGERAGEEEGDGTAR